MSETLLPARRASLRFGPPGSAPTPRVVAGSAVTAWCDVLDVLSAERAAAAGVAFKWVAPDGVPIRSRGRWRDGAWRSALSAEKPGSWVVEAWLATGGLIARAEFVVVASAFPVGARPAPVVPTPDGDVLDLRGGAPGPRPVPVLVTRDGALLLLSNGTCIGV